MKKIITSPGDHAFWPRVARGEVTDDDWRQFISAEGLSAAVDFPMSLYYKDLIKMYPNAKVELKIIDYILALPFSINLVSSIVFK